MTKPRTRDAARITRLIDRNVDDLYTDRKTHAEQGFRNRTLWDRAAALGMTAGLADQDVLDLGDDELEVFRLDQAVVHALAEDAHAQVEVEARGEEGEGDQRERVVLAQHAQEVERAGLVAVDLGQVPGGLGAAQLA